VVTIVEIIISLVQIFIFPGLFFLGTLSLTYAWIDRKFFAKLQNRIGPLYTGWRGILQPLADFIKLLAKEDIVPDGVDRKMFTATPILALSVIITSLFFLPIYQFSGIASFTGDLIFVLFLMTAFVIIKLLAGWFSTNRFSLIGTERTAIQLLGYEIPILVAAITPAILTQSLTISEIVAVQSAGYVAGDFLLGFTHWAIFGPAAIAFGIFIACSIAELEKVPFDIPEAETEIVAGWYTEFSGKKYGMFIFGVQLEMVFLAGLAAALFLGGPSGPIPAAGSLGVITPWVVGLLQTIYFIIKTVVFVLVIAFIRAIFARVRIDQMVNISWRIFLPLALLSVLLVILIGPLYLWL